jgi:long-subunit fatty acid transport protein
MFKKLNHHNNIIISLIALLMLQYSADAQLIPNLGGQRVGISSLQFLKIGVGARATAMGESFVAISNDASALFWNPAGLVNTEGNQVYISHTSYVADISHDFVGASYKISSSDVVGLSLISLSTNDMPVTDETNPRGNGRMFRYSDIAIGATYARQMTNQFSFGATVKYVEETLDVLKIRTVLVDLGTYYWTGLGSVRFAVVVTNFGSDVAPTGTAELYDKTKVSNFQSFSPPTLFKFGIAFEPFQTESQKITTSIQLNHPNDNVENVRLGAEYVWNDMFSIRAGVKRTIGEKLFGKAASSEEDIALGAGVKVPLNFAKFNADYSYANFNRLGGLHRISVQLTF